MRIAVTGASGLIGQALVPYLRVQGHEVLQLVRRATQAQDEVAWDPASGYVDLSAMAGVGACVHLAGVPVGKRRWTTSFKEEIRSSRVQGTHTIATALARMSDPPAVLISGSAMGYYGNAGDSPVDESSRIGSGFFPEVVAAWEAAAQPARDAGIRVVHPRTSIVVAGHGDTWGRLWPLFELGLGGRLGSGRQWFSFISLRDQVGALAFLLNNLEGPVNLSAPNPVTNAELTEALGRLLHRPTVLPVPAKALEIVLGEVAAEVLSSIRVLPRKLLDAGFEFLDPTIESALRYGKAIR